MATKQINPSVSTHTVDGLEKLQKDWACPQGQVIDRLMVFYEEFAEWKISLISSLQSLPVAPAPVAESQKSLAENDPYATLTTSPPTPLQLSLVRPSPKVPLWFRIFGARS